MKICTACQLEQPLNNFARTPWSKDGRYDDCRSCVRASKKASIELAKSEARETRRIANSEKAALAVENLKRCTKCKQVKPHQEYKHNKRFKDGYEYYCKRCLLDSGRKRDRKQKQLVVNNYGGQCACCGADTLEFLAIHHINGDGGEHRKTATMTIVSWLIKNNFPTGFQILCHNCHAALHFYGYCPHKNAVTVKAISDTNPPVINVSVN